MNRKAPSAAFPGGRAQDVAACFHPATQEATRRPSLGVGLQLRVRFKNVILGMPLHRYKHRVSYQYKVTRRGTTFENTWNMTRTKEIILVSPEGFEHHSSLPQRRARASETWWWPEHRPAEAAAPYGDTDLRLRKFPWPREIQSSHERSPGAMECPQQYILMSPFKKLVREALIPASRPKHHFTEL